MAAPTSLSALGQAALAYAGKGWPVFPCKQRGKEPLVRDWPNAATTNPERIRPCWNEHPTANIGHPTGKHVVLDIDGEEGEAALELLEKQHGPLPNTLTARTGKGRHLYFDANGTRTRNSAGKLGPHLDVRGEGGYVILPPSIHPSGKKYEWLSRMKPARSRNGSQNCFRSLSAGCHLIRVRARKSPKASVIRIWRHSPEVCDGAA